jgi:hypothetical protein
MIEAPAVAGEACAYLGCPNQPRSARDGAGARPKYCGQPDPVTGRPHTALEPAKAEPLHIEPGELDGPAGDFASFADVVRTGREPPEPEAG